ncbi:MAG: hypothetical protein ACREAW_04885 [Nitrososphaera sp.]
MSVRDYIRHCAHVGQTSPLHSFEVAESDGHAVVFVCCHRCMEQFYHTLVELFPVPESGVSRA